MFYGVFKVDEMLRALKSAVFVGFDNCLHDYLLNLLNVV